MSTTATEAEQAGVDHDEKAQLLELVGRIDDCDCTRVTAAIQDFLRVDREQRRQLALDDGETTTKLADVSPELDVAMRRWHYQADTILRTLRGPVFLLQQLLESIGWTNDHRLDTAVAIVQQCVARLEEHEDELDYARCHMLLSAEPAADGDGVLVATDGVSNAEQESPPDKRVKQTDNLVELIRAARILADGLELDDAGSELRLSIILRDIETAANDLFSKIGKLAAGGSTGSA